MICHHSGIACIANRNIKCLTINVRVTLKFHLMINSNMYIVGVYRT